MDGRLAGSALALAGVPVGALRLPRPFWAAATIAVALHLAVLAIRPGGPTSNYVAPASRVMAVRLVPPLARAEGPAAAAHPATAATDALASSTQPTRTTALDALPASTQPTRATASDRHVAPAKVARAEPVGEAAALDAAVAGSRREAEPSNPAPVALPQPSNAEAALPAAPDYAFGVRLDPGPRPLGEIEPDYPDPVHLRQGSVVLRLLISDTGHVDNVAVVRSEPRGVFEQAALDAFAKARFAPGLAAGTPVKSQITVEVQFVPTNRGGRVSGRTY